MTPHLRLKRQLVAAIGKPKPRVPEAGRLLWQWFAELHDRRTYSLAGPNPIAFTEIEAWARLNRWPLEARHVEVLVAMDRAFLAAYERKPEASAGSGMPITPAAFDAVFG